MSRIRLTVSGLLVAFVLSAVVAGTAQATVGGPVWIVPCHKVSAANKGTGKWNKQNAVTHKCEELATIPPLTGEGEFSEVLLQGETRNVTNIAGVSATQILASTAVSVECEKVGVQTGATNTIIGGNPGSDAATLVFSKCHVKGKTEAQCSVHSPTGGTGEIIVEVKTLLGYKKGATEKGEKAAKAIYEQFYPASETNEFVKLEFTGATCGTLAGTKQVVKATGTEAPKPIGFGKRNCGVIAEVGKITSGVFESAQSGEQVPLAGLNLPTTAIGEEEVWNSETKAFVVVKCSLTAAGTVATQSGLTSVALEGGEAFGIEI